MGAFAYASCRMINTYVLFLLLLLVKRIQPLQTRESQAGPSLFDACFDRVLDMLSGRATTSSWKTPIKTSERYYWTRKSVRMSPSTPEGTIKQKEKKTRSIF
jgi:hypothetical protein